MSRYAVLDLQRPTPLQRDLLACVARDGDIVTPRLAQIGEGVGR